MKSILGPILKLPIGSMPFLRTQKNSGFGGPNPLPLALVKQINEESPPYIFENSARKNVLIF
jgi:hypothetical protein